MQDMQTLKIAPFYIFRKEQDYFVRLNWHDDVLFPQQGVGENLKAIYKQVSSLKRG